MARPPAFCAGYSEAKAVVLMRTGGIWKRGKTFARLTVPPGIHPLGEDSLGSLTGPFKEVTVT